MKGRTKELEESEIHAVVLAAGRSARMGRQKLLLPFGSTTIIRHIVSQVLAGGLEGVLVVLGSESEALTRELADLPVSTVVNPRPEDGMLSSVRCGLRAVPPDCDGVLVVLGDQPAITAALVSDMIRAFGRADRRIVVPCFGGQRGHPLLFSTDYRDEVLLGLEAGGLRELLRAHPGDVLELPAGSSAVLRDMDVPGDYERELQERAREIRGESTDGR